MLKFIVKHGRSEMGVPEFGWTTQKVFHLMNLLVNGCKVATNFLHFLRIMVYRLNSFSDRFL
ncbi:hypothetical protein Hanom_Chr09g00797911 [Helianthus anomalus]